MPLAPPLPNNPAWDADAFYIGRAMATRLAGEVSALRESLLIDEIDPAVGDPKQVPAAVVMLDELTPDGGRNGQIPTSTVVQGWIVILAVRAGGVQRDRVASEVGGLIPATVKALHGWKPPGCTRALAWVAASGLKPKYGARISYYPLLFTTQITV
jgi:hypothetical protein